MSQEVRHLHPLAHCSVHQASPVTVERQPQPLAGSSDLVQPGERQADSATLVVSVLYRHQLSHGQVGILLPHFRLQLSHGEGPVLQVGERPGVDTAQLSHPALLVDVDVRFVPQQDLGPPAPAVSQNTDQVSHGPTGNHQGRLLTRQLSHPGL